MKKIYLAFCLILFLVAASFAAVDINTASKEELDGLVGIGPVKAEAIIKYRQEKGPFKNLEDLKNVYGIGDKIFERIKSDITIGSTEKATEDKGSAEAKADVKTDIAVKTEAAKPEVKTEAVPPVDAKQAESQPPAPKP